MRHPARGPALAGIDGKSNAAGHRRGGHRYSLRDEEAA